jgi:hypothetical protein
MELTKAQIRERGIPERIANKAFLIGLAEIAAYTGTSIAWVRDAIRSYGLPVTRKGRRLVTTKTIIDHWVREGHINLVETHDWDTIQAEEEAARRLDSRS